MRSLVIAALFVSTSAFACPELTGSYASCRSTTGSMGGMTDVVVTQAVQNGVTVYTIISTDNETQERSQEKIVADGVVRTETVTENGVELTVTSSNSCPGSALLMAQAISYQGQDVVTLNMNISKSGNTVTMAISGNSMGNQIAETLICE